MQKYMLFDIGLSEALFMFSVNNCKVQHEASEQLSE